MNEITVKEVNVQDYDVLLDVRTPQEYREGHIKDTLLIDIMQEDFPTNLQKLDKSKSYLVICRSGGRSARACEFMQELGFKQATNLVGGMLEWAEHNLPIQK